MTAERDFDRLVATWLDSRSTLRAPEGLLERSLARVETTRQRPGWLVRDRGRSPRAAGRSTRVDLRWVAAAVAVVVVAVGAGLVLKSSPAATVGPSSSPPVATASPVASSTVPSPTIPLARPASWLVTGSMGTARLGHVATLLRDGRVLVAGGANKACYCGVAYYASAELYDPATGSWTATGSMVGPGAYTFTLTQLADGRVLAAAWPTSELYDPSTGRWTVTGQMVADDASANATLLPDGRVLVAGGGGGGSVTCNGCAPRSSAELYDPVSGTWAALANMTRPRSAPTVTLLPNGKVLVAGGDAQTDRGRRGLATAELYDPATGTWTATGSMVTSVYAWNATLLPNGKVLVLGSDASSAPSAELYDPASGTWAATDHTIGQDLYEQPTVLRNGKVLVTAGSAFQLYDPATGTWTMTASMPVVRNGGAPYETVTLLSDGRVLVAGGALSPALGSAPGSAFVAVASAELYDPGSDE